jgi:hypothetical protein
VLSKIDSSQLFESILKATSKMFPTLSHLPCVQAAFTAVFESVILKSQPKDSITH